MKTYVGTKIVMAETEEKNGEDGYAVVYADGYRSWSPRATFEESYRRVSDREAAMVMPPASKVADRVEPEEVA